MRRTTWVLVVILAGVSVPAARQVRQAAEDRLALTELVARQKAQVPALHAAVRKWQLADRLAKAAPDSVAAQERLETSFALKHDRHLRYSEHSRPIHEVTDWHGPPPSLRRRLGEAIGTIRRALPGSW